MVAAIQQADCRNRLLARMRPEDFALLRLDRVALPLRHILLAPLTPVVDLFFVERGLASITTDASIGQVEVMMIGREGLVGAAPVLLGVDSLPFTCMMQMEGDAYRIATSDLLAAVAQSDPLRALLLRYVQALLAQAAYTGFSNAGFTIEARLARWLLMCRDRAEGDDILVTHEFLSTMLGVRRPGVTVAMQVLEGNGLVKAGRGRVTLLDRRGLTALTSDSYGLAEAEYERLIGQG